MDTVGLRVPTKQIRDFSTCNGSNFLRLSLATRCVTAANNICASLDVFNKHTNSLEDTLSSASRYRVHGSSHVTNVLYVIHSVAFSVSVVMYAFSGRLLWATCCWQAFILVSKSALLFWKLLVSEFLLGISEILHCSMSAPYLKIIPLLDVHQLLMLFAETLTFSEPGTFSCCYCSYYDYYYY
jgi:hypothetical protein